MRNRKAEDSIRVFTKKDLEILEKYSSLSERARWVRWQYGNLKAQMHEIQMPSNRIFIDPKGNGLDRILANDEYFLKIFKKKIDFKSLDAIAATYDHPQDRRLSEYLIELILDFPKNELKGFYEKELNILDLFTENKDLSKSIETRANLFRLEGNFEAEQRARELRNILSLINEENRFSVGVKCWIIHEDSKIKNNVISILEDSVKKNLNDVEFLESARKIKEHISLESGVHDFKDYPIDWILAQH